jgi:hypothetical protein
MRRSHLLIPSAVVLLFGSCAFSQTVPSVKQEAKDSHCSNILEHQRDDDAIMAKLENCLNAVNPNVPKTTYDCKGNSHVAGPGLNGVKNLVA